MSTKEELQAAANVVYEQVVPSIDLAKVVAAVNNL